MNYAKEIYNYDLHFHSHWSNKLISLTSICSPLFPTFENANYYRCFGNNLSDISFSLIPKGHVWIVYDISPPIEENGTFIFQFYFAATKSLHHINFEIVICVHLEFKAIKLEAFFKLQKDNCLIEWELDFFF